MNEKELRHALDETADRRRTATESLADQASTDFEIEGEQAQREHGIPSGLHEIRHISDYQNSVQELLEVAVTAELEAGTDKELVAAALDMELDSEELTETAGFTDQSRPDPSDRALIAAFAVPLMLSILWLFIAPTFVWYPEWFGLEVSEDAATFTAATGSFLLLGSTIIFRTLASTFAPRSVAARRVRTAFTWLMAASILLIPWHVALPGAVADAHSAPEQVSEGCASDSSNMFWWCAEPAEDEVGAGTWFEISDQTIAVTEQFRSGTPAPDLCDNALWVPSDDGLAAACVVGDQIIVGSIHRATETELADTALRSFETAWAGSFKGPFTIKPDAATYLRSRVFQFDEPLTPLDFELATVPNETTELERSQSAGSDHGGVSRDASRA
ncbi:hypothetical protein [Leucobacter sp. cx-169]|uniref:hypothetical protein n=1 Tax=Leucobacter sp. cx-169 TaxID=2770549 RepID=UPI00165DDAFD|nr:hypothetical protein [Leucobacter sp. cx-169]MBC9927183.1 hypothetical protein [Leucobacter sp. cx-169]